MRQLPQDVLSTKRLDAAQAERQRTRAAVEQDGCLLFGPGTNGRQLARALRARLHASPAVAFISDVEADRGRVVEGLPVLDRSEALARFGTRMPVVNCVLRADVTISRMTASLRRSGFEMVISLPAFSAAFAGELPPVYGFGDLAQLKADEGAATAAFNLLADGSSRAIYLALLEQRVSLDFSQERPVDPAIYFSPATPLQRHATQAAPFVFVDCGAYVGDTLRMFADWIGERPAHAVALEPDPNSFGALRRVADDLANRPNLQTTCVAAAAGAHAGRIGFSPLSNEASRVTPGDAHLVDMVSVDDVLAQLNARATYVKYDVEGFEREALQGARRAIIEDRAGLAVSVYHQPSDLWDIALSLHELQPAYDFFLREHGPDGVDTVLYALPRS